MKNPSLHSARYFALGLESVWNERQIIHIGIPNQEAEILRYLIRIEVSPRKITSGPMIREKRLSKDDNKRNGQ